MKSAARVGIGAWLGLAGLLAGGGCGSSPLSGKDGGADRPANGDAAVDQRSDATGRLIWVFQEITNRDIDILFMIDNSLGMAPHQARLMANFPVFMQVLQGLPNGLPSLHMAVVSSNMGSGRFEIPQCPLGGDQGVFQAQPRGACTASGLRPGQTFISNVNGVPNYSGTIEDVFGCIAPLGGDGCAFEHQLKSVVRALGADGFAPPPENAGFLRPNAYLAIILFTDEDDCSAPDDSDFADPGSRLVSDPLGPLSSFRCNEFGHLCDGAPPPRTRAASFGPGACVPAEGRGKLTPVAELVAQIQTLKSDRSKILVSVIAGLPDPYAVQLVPPLVRDDPSMWPAVAHSCLQNSGALADPGVRLSSFAGAFGRNGVYQTICADTFAPALQRIAEEVGRVVGPRCLDRPIRYTNGQPDCVVTERSYTSEGLPVDRLVPSCADNGNVSSCWGIVEGDAMTCTGQRVISIARTGTPPPDASIQLSCAPCTPGGADDCR